MNARKFKWIGIVIVLIIVLTTGVQAFYIYEDYQQNKTQYRAEMQQILDNSVEAYYAEIAKSDVITFTDTRDLDIKLDFPAKRNKNKDSTSIKSFFERFSSSKLADDRIRILDEFTGIEDSALSGIDSLNISYISIYRNEKQQDKEDMLVDTDNEIAMFKGKRAADSISDLEELTSKIIISITRDTLDFGKLNGYLKDEFDRNNMHVTYTLTHYKDDSITGSYNEELLGQLPFETTSKSTFLPKKQKLEMEYEDAALIILQKGTGNILFSLFFIILISIVLSYLYRIIKSQKALSEIKNDLISNITHEFKTPIATVSTAIEGIKSFNEANDPYKTEKYLDISGKQLLKLNQMVEKLLETATMDSEQLELHMEPANIQQMLRQLTEKYKTINPEKEIELDLQDTPPIAVDEFHFENALSNLLDNAIKYGGEHISVVLTQAHKTSITITDDGGNIPKGQQQRIFEKFYRVPKGNVHDVKGFGIGLYYTKTIIEKHGGTIQLDSNAQKTSFKITLP